jgi:hypothetical protein
MLSWVRVPTQKAWIFILPTCRAHAKAAKQMVLSYTYEFIRTWICMETSWHPSSFPWAAQGQIPANESEAHVCEYISYLFAILDRSGPSAKHEFSVYVSHLVLLVRDRVKWEKLLWHSWQ